MSSNPRRQLASVEALLSDPDLANRVQWHYRILDTIDSKTSHLLRFNAIVMAAQTFLVSPILKASAPAWVKVALVVLLLVPLAAAFRGLHVFRINWRFLDHCTGASAAEGVSKELEMLSEICDRRVMTQQGVWRGSRWSAGTFLLSIIAFAVMLVGWPQWFSVQ